MRPFLRLLALLLPALLALPIALRAAEPAPLRTALLAWEATPPRPDIQRVAGDLVALAQVELSAEPGIAWVERAELDKLLAEADLAASGRLDPRASLRVQTRPTRELGLRQPARLVFLHHLRTPLPRQPPLTFAVSRLLVSQHHLRLGLFHQPRLPAPPSPDYEAPGRTLSEHRR